ncbi:MAG: hypothetical protein M1822_002473 [Bathelium mastoideum]|nr:MAG: hypothetical protein M1822_002473 [Bathelium mastoideum]
MLLIQNRVIEAGWSDLHPAALKLLNPREFTLPRNHTSREPTGLEKRQSTSSYWLANIKRQGAIPYGNSNTSYNIFRNVKDYGAVGDGVTDDTIAINNAVSDGNRCGLGCDSSTTTPAIVYIPPGTYAVSSPIILYYYTQLIGDAVDMPTLFALPTFQGIGVLDSDRYLPYGANWYTNQNNFYRQIRNFIIDITQAGLGYAHGIHWQVAQATSLQNIVFNMRTDGQDDGTNQQQGIFMDNGSGGWLEDLIFNGGGICAFFGNQQFTTRNLTFNNCATAVYQNWDWVFAYKSYTFNNCQIGIDITQGGTVVTVGSIILQDSVFNNVVTGILTTFSTNSTPISGGTTVVDNVDFTGAQVAIAYPNGTTILPGGQFVQSWVQGRVYSAYSAEEQVGNLTCYLPQADSARIQQLVGAPSKPSALTVNGKIVERRKPQYEGVSVSNFVSVKDHNAMGDGVTDDTAAIQAIFDAAQPGQVIYFDHGAYVISSTVNVPSNIMIQGEIWPMIMALGSSPAFSDQYNPQPVFRVGQPGDVGDVEITELVFETLGPAPGAIMVEWNVAGTTPGAAAMWDTHWRIGGTAGTQLQSDRCTKTPGVVHGANSSCIGAFLLLHVTRTGSILMENNWGWVADHELDLADHNQIDIYNGRGALIESEGGGVWMYGTSFEHSMLYNYQIANAKNVYMSVIQSETAYMQNNPNSLTPFTPSSTFSDPDFGWCSPVIYTCPKTWGLRIYNSTYIFNYGAGLYSFFNNYDQGCLLTESCQEFMVSVEESEAIYLYALSTKAATTMVAIDEVAIVPESDNADSFCQTVAIFEYP